MKRLAVLNALKSVSSAKSADATAVSRLTLVGSVRFRPEPSRFQRSRPVFPAELGLLRPEQVKFRCALGKFASEPGQIPLGLVGRSVL